MKELLRRWANAAPNECQRDDLVFTMLGLHVDAISEFGPLEKAIIQHQTQKAIEARDWDWCLGCGEGDYLGDVYTNGANSTQDEQFSVFAEFATYALLEAYVHALEAQNKEVKQCQDK